MDETTGVYSIIPAPDERKVIRDYLISNHSEPIALINHFYPLSDFSADRLSAGAKRFLEIPNAGGSSVFSEALSCELFSSLYHGKYLRTEMEIDYICQAFKPVDMLIKLPVKGKYINVAISTTRAMAHWGHELYTRELADKLIRRKVMQLILARDAVCDNDGFEKSILHVWCQTDRIAKIVSSSFFELDPDSTKNILCICTVTNYRKIYTNF